MPKSFASLPCVRQRRCSSDRPGGNRSPSFKRGQIGPMGLIAKIFLANSGIRLNIDLMSKIIFGRMHPAFILNPHYRVL